MDIKLSDDVITLKGNELAWIMKLANERYLEMKLAGEFENEYKALDEFLSGVLGRFHSSNFFAGSSNTVWVLSRIKSLPKLFWGTDEVDLDG